MFKCGCRTDETGKTALASLKGAAIKPVSYSSGKAHMPQVTFKGKGTMSVLNKDYTVKYEHNEVAGTGFILLEAAADSSFIGTRRIAFKINGTPMAKAKAVGLEKNYPFERAPIEPIGGSKVKVTVGGKTLEHGVDYTVTYEKNVYKGTDIVLFRKEKISVRHSLRLIHGVCRKSDRADTG